MIHHTDKLKSIIITTLQKHKLAPLKLNSILKSLLFKKVKTHKVLGIILDQNLSLDGEVTHLCKMLAKKITSYRNFLKQLTLIHYSFFPMHTFSPILTMLSVFGMVLAKLN